VTIMAEVGAVYINFGLWGIAILPAWLVLRRFGAEHEHYGPYGEPQVESGLRDSASLGEEVVEEIRNKRIEN
jgi:hypothetical protein